MSKRRVYTVRVAQALAARLRNALRERGIQLMVFDLGAVECAAMVSYNGTARQLVASLRASIKGPQLSVEETR